ncbi:MAG: hypothetical protein GY760_26630 [Deltaproteobacteria bacterium]|nr:hypothetical protein [Deltaproteobacteria bacterium]
MNRKLFRKVLNNFEKGKWVDNVTIADLFDRDVRSVAERILKIRCSDNFRKKYLKPIKYKTHNNITYYNYELSPEYFMWYLMYTKGEISDKLKEKYIEYFFDKVRFKSSLKNHEKPTFSTILDNFKEGRKVNNLLIHKVFKRTKYDVIKSFHKIQCSKKFKKKNLTLSGEIYELTPSYFIWFFFQSTQYMSKLREEYIEYLFGNKTKIDEKVIISDFSTRPIITTRAKNIFNERLLELGDKTKNLTAKEIRKEIGLPDKDIYHYLRANNTVYKPGDYIQTKKRTKKDPDKAEKVIRRKKIKTTEPEKPAKKQTEKVIRRRKIKTIEPEKPAKKQTEKVIRRKKIRRKAVWDAIQLTNDDNDAAKILGISPTKFKTLKQEYKL